MRHLPSNFVLLGMTVITGTLAIVTASEGLLGVLSLVLFAACVLAFEIPTKFFRYLALVYMELYSCWREMRCK